VLNYIEKRLKLELQWLVSFRRLVFVGKLRLNRTVESATPSLLLPRSDFPYAGAGARVRVSCLGSCPKDDPRPTRRIGFEDVGLKIKQSPQTETYHLRPEGFVVSASLWRDFRAQALGPEHDDAGRSLPALFAD
jgi:hypothetical protein